MRNGTQYGHAKVGRTPAAAYTAKASPSPPPLPPLSLTLTLPVCPATPPPLRLQIILENEDKLTWQWHRNVDGEPINMDEITICNTARGLATACGGPL